LSVAQLRLSVLGFVRGHVSVTSATSLDALLAEVICDL